VRTDKLIHEISQRFLAEKRFESLGQHLRQLRHRCKMTLRQVEAKSGFSNAAISQIETGHTKQPSPKMLRALASVYGVSYHDLMERAVAPVPPASPPVAKPVLLRVTVTVEEEAALLEYLEFLRYRSRGSDERG
jgi:transcriptional regulator with XRE-family HTH domain